ncbi:hypothetical protein Pcinc_030507 [Petrolisthes cinctipes]|uniref:PDZ GRASP-type domain-containing protein n=1 Tax=Petrolisthes cinctipes TaxID=88211 RepID=A0AAE1K2F9_PETCI|nr:hypothetical protein Pcinc_030507 [Petrolisthes cinctipes]
MGGTQSVNIPGGGMEGYHVLRVQENSPGQLAGLEAFFDFIISIGKTRLDQDNDTLKELLKSSIEKELQMTVYSSKTQTIRYIKITPSNLWGGQGLLGVSIRFCSFEGANENVWHILDVEPNSPADIAGLQGYKDYIIGADSVLHESEDLFSLIEAHEGRPLKLYVYNVETDSCREVTVTPDTQWGGSGSLGCGIGYGYLHRIPTQRPGEGSPAGIPGTSPDDASDAEPLLQVATGRELETMTSSVAGLNLSEPSAVIATSGSTIPPPTAFTASHMHSLSGVSTDSTAARYTSPVSPAGPNIPPPAAFTPISLPPPKELPPNITSHMSPPTTSQVPLAFPSAPVQSPLMPSSDAPGQIPSQTPVHMLGEVPMQPSPSPYSMNPILPPSSVPQPSPLTMGAVPTVPVTAGIPQGVGHTDTSIPMAPLPSPMSPMQVPPISQSYTSAVHPPVPPTFTAPPAMPSIPGMPVTTPINLPGMPPITVSATLPPDSFQGISSTSQSAVHPQPVQ